MTQDEIQEIMQEKITKYSTYFGIQTLKCPTDAWIYQEIVTDIKPDVIVEIGNFRGGSALMFAHWLDQLHRGLVVAVDQNHGAVDVEAWNHPRIRWVTGDAISVVNRVRERCKDAEVVLVIEDSSHEYANTLNILEAYAPLVTKGSYFIVEDTICRHGLNVGPNPGPYEAVQDFLKNNQHFVSDRTKEPYLITWNPTGYLKRIL